MIRNWRSVLLSLKLNKNSVRAVKEIRGEDDTNEDPSERLYKNHEISILQKEKFIEAELMRERELETKECTFKPVLRKDAIYSQVKAKVSAKPKTHQEHQVDRKKYTFTPNVKGIVKGMVNAEQYVSTNVVDRLTKPLVSPPDGTDVQETFDKPAIDMETFMGTNSSSRTPATKPRPGSAPPRLVLLSGRGCERRRSITLSGEWSSARPAANRG